MDHDNEADMVRDASLAYRDTDERGRQVYCPVCLKHRGIDGHAVIIVYRKLGINRKSIGRHLVTKKGISEHWMRSRRRPLRKKDVARLG